MKFDMGRAWSDTIEILTKNFGLIATVLGLFYFLPSFAISILFPEIVNAQPPQAPPGTDPAIVFENLREFVIDSWAQSWPLFVLTTLLQYVGAIAVLALFRPDGQPTVGEALKIGAFGTPTYFATGIITAIAAGIVIGAPLGIGFAITPILGVLLIIPAIIAIVYITVKLMLVPAVIGMEGTLNPIQVMLRSWRLTKGNSVRIFLFLLTLTIVAGLIYVLIIGVLTTVLAVMGDTVATIGGGFVTSLAAAIFGGLFLVVIGAIYLQLAAEPAAQEVETFE